MIEKLLEFRLFYLAALALVAAVAGSFALRIEVEQNNESMNSLSQAERAAHDELREVFGEDEDLIVAYRSPGLRTEAGIRALAQLTTRIEAIAGVRRVYSLTNAVELVPGPDGAEERPLLPALGTTDFETRVGAALARNPELAGFLIGRDRQTAGLWVELEHRPGDSDYRRVVIDSLRRLADELARPSDSGGGLGGSDRNARIHFTGIAAQKYEVSRLLDRDQGVLIPASVVVLGLVLLVFFRSVAGVALPLLVTGATLVLTLGLYQLCGLALNTMTSLLPPVLMVLSVSTSVHLVEHWRRNAPSYPDAPSAIAATLVALRFPCTLTSVTTAIGMSSLAVSATPAVQTFGVFTAIGVLISLALSLTLVPIGLSFLPHPTSVVLGPFSRAVDSMLAAASRLSRSHPRPIVAGALILTVAGVSGIATVQNNTDLVRFLKSTNPLYLDTLAVDEHLCGVNAIELVVSRRDGAALDTADTTLRLEALRATLVGHPRVSGVQSVLDVLSAIQRAERGGGELGSDAAAVLEAWDLLSAVGDSDLVRRLVDQGFERTRLRVLVHSMGSAEAAPVEDWILAQASGILGEAYRVDATGSFHQVIRDSNRLVATQATSFATALGLVLLAIGVMLRSLRLMLYSIIPNLVPVLWTGGLMGLLGIDLSTGTAMIASVVIGIAVDDTIHYLTRFRRERGAGAAVAAAIDRTTTETGRALVVSSIVLAVGFWVGALGSFKPTIYFSLLTGLTMLSALICDLLVLPATLMLGASRNEDAR